MKNIARFEEMKAACCAWEEAKQERRARKQQIIDTLGWDSPELKAWYEEDQNTAYPYTSGQVKAMRAFADSLKREDGIVEMSDSCWESEWHDFVTTLRDLGAERMIVTNQSTGLMDDLYGYAAEGCTMTGLQTITKLVDRWGGEEEETIKGIGFDLN